jgi:hypothetical protein
VEHTGAEFVFRPAAGGLFALYGAIGSNRISRVAAYEPLLMLEAGDDTEIRRVFTTMRTLIRFDRGGEAIFFSIVEAAARAARNRRVRGADGRQRWVRAVDLRPANGSRPDHSR